MIELIETFFTIEMIYLWLNIGVLPFWILLIFFSNTKLSSFLVTSIFPHIILGTLYVYLVYYFYISGYDFFNNFKLYLGIKHLIYPIPEGFGLGIHLTLELDDSIKFGPDVQWVDNPLDYSVDESRKENFVLEIKKYLPSFNAELLKASYSGISPILGNKSKSMRDFVVQDHSIHSIPNLINLYGIESPGLTSSLEIAKYVEGLLE